MLPPSMASCSMRVTFALCRSLTGARRHFQALSDVRRYRGLVRKLNSRTSGAAAAQCFLACSPASCCRCIQEKVQGGCFTVMLHTTCQWLLFICSACFECMILAAAAMATHRALYLLRL